MTTLLPSAAHWHIAGMVAAVPHSPIRCMAESMADRATTTVP